MRKNTLTRFIVSVLKRLRILPWVNTVIRVKYGEKRIRVPLRAGIGASNFSWTEHEPWLGAILKDLLNRKKGSFVDVGANVGQTLLRFIETGSTMPYYGFEPDPLACGYLHHFCKLNGLDNVTVISAALSDHNGFEKLFGEGAADDSASIVEGFLGTRDYGVFAYVPVYRGDEVINALRITSISVLKIDVEGGELEVLRGLRGTIRRLKPFILCEILPVYYDEGHPIGRLRRARTDNVLDLLREEGYECARVSQDGTVVPLTNIENHRDPALCEYLFVPGPLLMTLVKPRPSLS